MNEKNAVKHLKKALLVDADKHNYLFDILPEARLNETIVKLIDKYGNKS
jgi:hypothetical protein